MPTDRERSRVAESARLEAAGLIHAIIKDGHVDVPAAVRGVVEQALLNDLIVLAIVPPTKTT